MGEFLCYTLESGLIMAVLYLTYKWLMASGTLHGFKRAMLLLILALSWVVPAVIPMVQFNGGSGVDIALPMPVYLVESNEAHANMAWGWEQWFCLTYLAGVVATFAYTLAGVVRVNVIIRSGRREAYGRYTLIVTERTPGPFSWGNYIVIRPEDCDEYKDLVLKHETAHLARLHWMDLIFCQINVILQWYNPASWLLMHELKSVHEYQADASAAGDHPYNYQIMLIKKAAGSSFPTFADSLNHSQLKTRLTMMLKPKSKATRCVAALAIPVMTMAAVFILSVPSVAGALSAVKSAEMSVDSNSKVTKTAVTGQVPEVKAEQEKVPLAVDVVVLGYGDEAAAEVAGQVAYFVNDKLFTGDIKKISPEKISSMVVKKDDPAYPQGKVMVYLKGYKNGSEMEVEKSVASVAKFVGGDAALRRFLSDNVRWPQGVKLDKPERVFVKFTIGTDGSVSNPEVIKGNRNEKLDAEAIRVVKLTDGSWVPAMDAENKLIATSYVVPIIFSQK